MQESAFYNIIINISFLVTVATLLVSTTFFQKILLHPDTLWLKEQIALGTIFGTFCVMSNVMGIHIDGALLNARVIGVLAAGILGGPVSGILAAVIGVIHRYWIDPWGMTTFACCLSTMVQGVGGAVIWKVYYQKNHRYSDLFLFVVTAVFETLHMLFTLIFSHPLAKMMEVVRIISLPMILLNAFGMVILFRVFTSVYKMQDKDMARKLFLTFRIAERSLPYLRKIEKEPDNFQKIIDIFMEENDDCVGAAILDQNGFYGKSSILDHITWKSEHPPILLKRIMEQEDTVSMDYGIAGDVLEPLFDKNTAVGAPLRIAGRTVAYMIMFVKKREFSSEADISFIGGLTALCSAQMSLAQMEEQKKLLRKAQLQALQSQINPHFLFNALNTISCFCREKPERARELLLALSTYFRNSLKNTDYMVTLAEEIQHIDAYLELEKARFEERLLVKSKIAEATKEVLVPNLILQPLVENAVKHGATKRQQGVVKITTWEEKKYICIMVEDNGTGIPKEVCQRLERHEQPKEGIGLWNVNERLQTIYQNQALLRIEAGEEGSRIIMSLPIDIS